MIKVSVITVVFNDFSNISKTINSVLEQNYLNTEYIVIDGGSTDGTSEVIERYLDKLNIYISEVDYGIYDAMNKGVRVANGEFIIFMNSGDVFAAMNSISLLMNAAIQGVEQVIFGSWMRYSQTKNSSVLCHPDTDKISFNHQATVYSRNIHLRHGEYLNIKGLTTADYLFFSTVLMKSPSILVSVIKAATAIIDVHGASAGLQTISQKSCIDYLFGRLSKFQLIIILLAHPVYRGIKVLLRGKR